MCFSFLLQLLVHTKMRNILKRFSYALHSDSTYSYEFRLQNWLIVCLLALKYILRNLQCLQNGSSAFCCAITFLVESDDFRLLLSTFIKIWQTVKQNTGCMLKTGINAMSYVTFATKGLLPQNWSTQRIISLAKFKINNSTRVLKWCIILTSNGCVESD